MRYIILIISINVVLATDRTCEATLIMCITEHQEVYLEDDLYHATTIIRVPLKYNEWAQYDGWDGSVKYLYFRGDSESLSRSFSYQKADMTARGNASCLFNQVEYGSWVKPIKKSFLDRLLGK